MVNRPYLVTGTARTGSTLLCQMLTDTGIAGRPAEYFNATLEDGWRREMGIVDRLAQPYDEYIKAVIQHATTPNGVFGTKLLWRQLFETILTRVRRMPRMADATASDVLSAYFPNARYIFVQRLDKVLQAVSYEKAAQTNIWNVPKGAQVRYRNDIGFDHARITRHIEWIRQSERDWRAYFHTASITPLELTYEELAREPMAAVHRVLDYLELDYPRDLAIAPRIERQFDAVNEEWAELYRAIESGVKIVYELVIED